MFDHFVVALALLMALEPSLRESRVLSILPNPEHISPITLLSLRLLFFVSILHSSQKTRDSGLLGSECSLKHLAQMECPQRRVRGMGALVPGPHFRNCRHDRQDSVEET